MDIDALLAAGTTVLTASRRLAHALRARYAHRARAQGLEVWASPRVLPWTTWLRQQYVEARASAADPVSFRRVLTQAQAAALWDEVVTQSALAEHLLNPRSAARSAARSWRRIHEHLIPIDQLAAFETPEAQALGAWCNAFQTRCDQLRAIDELQLGHWAHEHQWVPHEPIALMGFDIMPPVLQRLVERWRDCGRVVAVENAPHQAQVQTFGAEEGEAELAAAARWARERVLTGASSVGVIVSNLQAQRERVRRIFEDVLAPGARQVLQPSAPLPAVIAGSAPLATYGMIDAALLVLGLAANDVDHLDVGRLLRSPFIAGGEQERGARALADIRLREEQREVWTWPSMEIFADVTRCEVLRNHARKLNARLRKLPSSASASAWSVHFHALLLDAGWPGERALSSEEYQTWQKLQGALAELGALDGIAPQMTLRQALRRLRDHLTDTMFEPQTGDAPIIVIDAATSAGMHFDALWVVGLDATRWPAPAAPDPLIPLDLQRQAGIPEATAAGMLQLARTQLQRWTTSATQVVLSWTRRDGDVEFHPSPLLAPFAPLTTPDDTNAPVALRNALFGARPVLEWVQDDRAPTVPPSAARGGARTLELQSRCAFRAQAEMRLQASQVPRIALGVKPIDRGAILHHVLEDLWRQLKDQQGLFACESHELEQRVRELAHLHVMKELATETPHRVRLAMLEIDSTTAQVLRLLEKERERPAFSVQLAEEFEPYSIGGLSITLRPDRIDSLAAGGQLLIDYKLGDSHRPRDWLDALPGRPRRPQLPLYALAHADQMKALAYVVLAPGAVEYRGWSDGTPVGPGVDPYPPPRMRIDFGDPTDWDALLHQWKFSLTRLAEHYVAGDAAVDPLPQECATCHLSALCRIHEQTQHEATEIDHGD